MLVIDRGTHVSALDAVPLIVDLDGTLLRSDMLYENYFNTVSLGAAHHLRCLRALARGKAALKSCLAASGTIDYGRLPYDDGVLALIGAARDEGRPVYLATASDIVHAQGVAAHLGVFTGFFASEGGVNLSGEAKARELVERFGAGGFDYAGNDAADLAVWAKARRAYTVRTSARVDSRLSRLGVPVQALGSTPATVRTWAKAIRVHQYAKNTLVFVPLLTSHVVSLAAVAAALLAFVAFSACASAVYLINDLLDLEADRAHPSKRNRPFASGAIPLAHAAVAVPLLLVLAAGCALVVSAPFLAVLAGYFVLTTAYSVSLKRKMLIDAVVLAMLYTLRVIGGAAAIDVAVSQWLLAFSIFMFLSLALMKRYVELQLRLDEGLPDPSNRNYRLGDSVIVAALAAASGFNAITIFSLYIASPDVQALYRRPELLWLMCPILTYWVARALMMAHRRLMNDDPILFALRDRNSQVAGVLMVAIVVAAI